MFSKRSVLIALAVGVLTLFGGLNHADSSDGIVLAAERVGADTTQLSWSSPAASTCCSAQGTGGCDDPVVEACVCAQYSFCCSSTWSQFCVDQVNPTCGGCPAYEVSRSQDPSTATAPASRLGTTSDTAWTDFPEPGDVFYYHVAGGVAMDASATPDGFIVNTASTVQIQVIVPPAPLLDASSVRVFRLDDQLNNVGAALCSPLDNGNPANGDDTAGDGTYSCLVPFNELEVATIAVRVEATIDTAVIRSAALNLDVVADITMAEAMTADVGQTDAFDIWSTVSGTMGDNLAARQETASQVEALSGVTAAGVSSDQQTIWIEYDSGLSGLLMLNPPGTKGGGSADPIGSVSGSTVFAAGGPPNIVGDPSFVDAGDVLIWSPFRDEFGAGDEGPVASTIYGNFGFTVTDQANGACTLGSMSGFANYDTVVISSHGMRDSSGIVHILTRSPANATTIAANTVALRQGRISRGTVAGGTFFTATPAIIRSIGGKFENGIIYAGSCSSGANGTMANAFRGKGANTYYGYSDTVSVGFAHGTISQLLEELVNQLNVTGESYNAVSPKADPSNPGVFLQFGDANTSYK